MREDSSLSEVQREAAVSLFDAGWGAKATAARLGVDKAPVRRLYERWRVRGGTALVTKPTKRLFSFDFKLEAVQRFLSGENKVALAKALALSSPRLLEKWAQQYRDAGEEGLRPKPKGRPKSSLAAPARAESELQRLRRENEHLRAEVAFLGKVQALRGEERR